MDQLCLGFHFISAAGEGVNRWGGDRRRLREVYIIQASAGVSLARNVDEVPAQLEVAFVEDGSEITVAGFSY